MSNSSESTVWVETNVLNEWCTDLDKRHDDIVDILCKIQNEINNNVNDSWKGNAATGFINASNDVIKLAKNLHNGMRDTNTFLKTVVQHMEDR